MRLICALAAALCVGAAGPTLADIHQIGAVNVAADHYTRVSWSNFDGPVYRLRFAADNDTVDCSHVIVTYRDGTTHDVFSGTVVRDGSETITFPEGDSRIRNVDFACRAQSLDGARLSLSSVSGDSFPGGDNDRLALAHVRTGTSSVWSDASSGSN